mmetsp:Transcript_2846/g.8933  ORF Transcript_2846/g.8933 Transcript_2846/m.8933 type:complete len:223 (-) Transcript_2846:29-697(-)
MKGGKSTAKEEEVYGVERAAKIRTRLHAHEGHVALAAEFAPSLGLASAPAGAVGVVHVLHDPVLVERRADFLELFVLVVEGLVLVLEVVLAKNGWARIERLAGGVADLVVLRIVVPRPLGLESVVDFLLVEEGGGFPRRHRLVVLVYLDDVAERGSRAGVLSLGRVALGLFALVQPGELSLDVPDEEAVVVEFLGVLGGESEVVPRVRELVEIDARDRKSVL